MKALSPLEEEHSQTSTLLMTRMEREQGKMERTGCEIICVAPTTLMFKGYMMMMMIFCRNSTWQSASNRVTYFILRAYAGTGVSHRQYRKNMGEVLEKMQVNGPEE